MEEGNGVYSPNRTEAAIRELIATRGRITFRDFMELALYTAPEAYYASTVDKLGRRGDYFTSPELHPAFGALLARQVEQLWLAMGRPSAFTIVEMGPGTGILARDILGYAARHSPEFHETIEYVLVERSPGLRNQQRRTLAGKDVAGRIRHIGSLLDLSERSVRGCFLSNELFDAFPVHRVVVRGGRLQELFVEVVSGRLQEREGELSTPGIAEYFQRLGFLPPEGCQAEVNLEALTWMRHLAQRLDTGAVLTLDYGYPAEEMFSSKHCGGTLLCFYRHSLNSDPFARVGRQDITTHVDFTSLAHAGEQEGLSTVGLTTQRSFLAALGMERYLALLPQLGLSSREFEANRIAIGELLDPRGLGRVMVLAQQRGLDGFSPAGLATGSPQSGALGRDTSDEPPPLQTERHLDLTAISDPSARLDVEGMWSELMGEDDE